MLLGNLVDNLFLGAVVKSRRRNLLFWTLRQGSKYVATSLSKSTNKALSKDGNNVKPTLAMLECSNLKMTSQQWPFSPQEECIAR